MNPFPALRLDVRAVHALLLSAALGAVACSARPTQRPATASPTAAAAAPAAAPAASDAAAPQSRCVTVLSTNDMHGSVEPHELEAAGHKLRFGGLLVLATYVEALRERDHDRVLLLDAGDIYQGSLVSNLSAGRAMITAMSALHYDASAIGNHEFDFGSGDEGNVAAAPGAHPEAAGAHPGDLLSVVKARIAEARFPFLAANVVERATHRVIAWPNTRPTLLVTRGGVKVGIVGVSTPETPRVTRPQNVQSLEFADPVPAVIAAARELRAAGAELVVLLGHMGGECSRTDDPHDLSSCDDGEMFQVIHRLPRGTVDVAVGGHTHQVIAHWVDGVAVTEASARARALGYIEACVAPGGGIDPDRSRIHPPILLCLDAWPDGTCSGAPAPGVAAEVQPATFLGRPVAPSTELAAVLEPFRDRVQAEVQRPIGAHLDKPLQAYGPGGTSPLGEVLLEAMRATAGTPIAVQNRGGIRADIPRGDVTYGEVFEAMPFDNRVAVLELDGDELAALVRHVAGRSRGKPLVAGLSIVTTTRGTEVRLADGSPLVRAHRYAVATNDYLALGGEGLGKVLGKVGPDRVQVLDLEVRTSLIDYLRKTYPAPAGR